MDISCVPLIGYWWRLLPGSAGIAGSVRKGPRTRGTSSGKQGRRWPPCSRAASHTRYCLQQGDLAPDAWARTCRGNARSWKSGGAGIRRLPEDLVDAAGAAVPRWLQNPTEPLPPVWAKTRAVVRPKSRSLDIDAHRPVLLSEPRVGQVQRAFLLQHEDGLRAQLARSRKKVKWGRADAHILTAQLLAAPDALDPAVDIEREDPWSLRRCEGPCEGHVGRHNPRESRGGGRRGLGLRLRLLLFGGAR